jgi:hypothetical protein
VKVNDHHDLLAAARANALTPAFTEPYRQHRPMVERSIAWLIRRDGRRFATAASPATASHWPTGAPPPTCAGSSTSESNGTTAGQRPPEPAGPGLTKRERHLRALTHPARPASTLEHRLFGRSCPRTHHPRYDSTTAPDSATCPAVS